MNWQFFVEVLVSGLLVGLMYSLVALGFVLIYKASGVFNFAQGAMMFFAALRRFAVEAGVNPSLGGHRDHDHGHGRARHVYRATGLRPLVNRRWSLFMATIGLTFVLEGLSQRFWGSQPRGLSSAWSTSR